MNPTSILSAEQAGFVNQTACGSAARALILDDQEAIAEVLAEMVRLSGCEAVAESDPQRALERVESEEFDVILSDFRMPEMNGQEFYEAAVAARPELSQRIIFLTGDLHNDETQEFLKSTGAACISKPFHLRKVQQALAEVLGCGVLS